MASIYSIVFFIIDLANWLDARGVKKLKQKQSIINMGEEMNTVNSKVSNTKLKETVNDAHEQQQFDEDSKLEESYADFKPKGDHLNIEKSNFTHNEFKDEMKSQPNFSKQSYFAKFRRQSPLKNTKDNHLKLSDLISISNFGDNTMPYVEEDNLSFRPSHTENNERKSIKEEPLESFDSHMLVRNHFRMKM